MIGVTPRKLNLVNQGTEEWKTVEEFGEYQVSSKGRVRKWFRGNWRYPTLPKASHGASRKVTFIEDGVTYGRMLGKLVYETFLGVETKQDIVYLDSDKENCSLENLVTLDELFEAYKLCQEELDYSTNRKLALLKKKLTLDKEEEWKTVEEFGEYQVSSKGRVRKWFRGNWRYVTLPKATVGSSRKVTFIEDGVTHGRMLGKLVYETFLGIETNQNIVYLDSDKENCSLINLATIDELVEAYKLYYYNTNIDKKIVRKVKTEFSDITQVQENVRKKIHQVESIEDKIYNIIKVSNEVIMENMYAEEFQKLLESLDSSGDIEIRQGLVKIRRYNKRIIDELKKEYSHVCQLCGHLDTTKVDYDVSIVEGHHIEPFSLTKDNSPKNLIILCPNHHRLIHKLNAKWNNDKKCFELENGQYLPLEINHHL